jgi:HEAT repeat protein
VPIHASSARQVDSLVADLSSDRPALREAAVARLTLLGARAVDRLLRLLAANVEPHVRCSALRIIEAVGDARAVEPVLALIDSSDVDVAAAAASAARVFMTGECGPRVVDRLTAATLNQARADRVRLACLDALRGLGHSTIAPLLDKLRLDPGVAMRAAVDPQTGMDPSKDVVRAAESGLPDEPQELIDAVNLCASQVPVPLLLRLIERLREREHADSRRSPEWQRARGRIHLALAARGSRIALWDLRESFENAAAPLPVEFLAALSAAGDAACLESVAAAYARSASASGSAASGAEWWQAQLVDLFAAIVARERVTRRHAVMKKIAKRSGPILGDLTARRRATPAVSTLSQTTLRPAPVDRT